MQNLNRVNFRVLIFAALFPAAVVALGGCNSSKPVAPQPAEQTSEQAPAPTPPAPHRYAMQGRIVSVDKDGSKLTVQHGDIPGFMTAMTMPYPVRNTTVLNTVKPDDNIKADVVVDDSGYYLDNVTVVPKDPNARPQH